MQQKIQVQQSFAFIKTKKHDSSACTEMKLLHTKPLPPLSFHPANYVTPLSANDMPAFSNPAPHLAGKYRLAKAQKRRHSFLFAGGRMRLQQDWRCDSGAAPMIGEAAPEQESDEQVMKRESF